MRRGLLLVAGGAFSEEALQHITAWWKGSQQGVLVLQADSPEARVLFVDLDALAVVADTDGAPCVALVNAPPGSDGLAEAADAAVRLGADGPAVVTLLEGALGRERP